MGREGCNIVSEGRRQEERDGRGEGKKEAVGTKKRREKQEEGRLWKGRSRQRCRRGRWKENGTNERSSCFMPLFWLSRAVDEASEADPPPG